MVTKRYTGERVRICRRIHASLLPAETPIAGAKRAGQSRRLVARMSSRRSSVHLGSAGSKIKCVPALGRGLETCATLRRCRVAVVGISVYRHLTEVDLAIWSDSNYPSVNWLASLAVTLATVPVRAAPFTSVGATQSQNGKWCRAESPSMLALVTVQPTKQGKQIAGGLQQYARLSSSTFCQVHATGIGGLDRRRHRRRRDVLLTKESADDAVDSGNLGSGDRDKVNGVFTMLRSILYARVVAIRGYDCAWEGSKPVRRNQDRARALGNDPCSSVRIPRLQAGLGRSSTRGTKPAQQTFTNVAVASEKGREQWIPTR